MPNTDKHCIYFLKEELYYILMSVKTDYQNLLNNEPEDEEEEESREENLSHLFSVIKKIESKISQ